MKTLNEIVNEYGDYVVKDGFMDFLEKPVSISVWDLEIGDKYFYIDTEGYINSETWQNDATDNLRRCIGNTFPTLKEAQFEKKRREVYAQVKRYAHEFSKEEWNDTKINKYYACYNYKDHSIIKGFNSHVSNSKLYFQSIKDIDRAIAAVGVEDFKKYYLGVKE